MTADEPVEARRRLKACVDAWPDCWSGGYNPSCCRFPKSCSCTVYDPQFVSEADLEPEPNPSPSMPVESREQPRGSMQHRIDVAVIGMANDRAERWKQRCFTARTETAERDATIRELRAEAAREFESGNEWCQRALASEAALETTRAERDRARDLAAHLAASVVKLADDWDEETQAVINWDSASMARRTAYRAVTRDLRALAAHLEAEHAQ